MAKRRLYFHIHGTTGLIGDYGTTLFKGLAGTFCKDLFTTASTHQLIPIDQAPSAARHFSPLYTPFTNEADRHYFQWSGNLSEVARKKAARYLADQIRLMAIDDDEVEVIILGHSHGGTIARHVAESFVDDDRFIFHIITNATPLCSAPPQLMPLENVKTWQHFYNDKDPNAGIGTVLLQSGQCAPLNRRLEAVAGLVPDGFDLPRTWQSHALDCGNSDLHNNAMRAQAAAQVCSIVTPVMAEAMGVEMFFDVQESDVVALSRIGLS